MIRNCETEYKKSTKTNGKEKNYDYALVYSRNKFQSMNQYQF